MGSPQTLWTYLANAYGRFSDNQDPTYLSPAHAHSNENPLPGNPFNVERCHCTKLKCCS
jgi:hypothetical protein